MNDVGLALLVASTLLGTAATVALIPVSRIHTLVGNRNLRQESEQTSWDATPQIGEDPPHTRDVRQEIFSAAMRAYLHDRTARDHLQIAAATQNLHPLGPEDVLTQLILLRRDLNRVARDYTQQRGYGYSTNPNRSEYFYSIGETTVRNDFFSIKHFQRKISDLDTQKPSPPPQRRKITKRTGRVSA